MTDWIGYRTEIYPPSYRPADTAADHLAFALRYEGIHLEFLHRLFQKLDRTALEAWIAHEPTGQYARRSMDYPPAKRLDRFSTHMTHCRGSFCTRQRCRVTGKATKPSF